MPEFSTPDRALPSLLSARPARRLRGAWVVATAWLVAALTVGCSRTPDCDSDQAHAQVSASIFAMVRGELRDPKRMPMQEIVRAGADAVVSDRHRQLNDAYLPELSIADDARWLRPRIAAGAENLYKGIDIATYLSVRDSAALKRLLRIRLTGHERLPDRQGERTTISKVCRATLWLEPAAGGAVPSAPLTVVYAASPPPRRSPLYIPVRWFDVTEPPLPFEPSDGEKVTLMMYGATDSMAAVPRPQRPERILLRRALRAMRHSIAATPMPQPPASSAPPAAGR